MKARILLWPALVFLTACETVPRDAFRLPESTLALRNTQTREYQSVSDTQILSASVAVLQDMGYAIDEVEELLGVISASKRADASNKIEFLGSVVFEGVKCVFTLARDCNARSYNEVGDVQDIRMTLVSRPTLENGKDVVVRVTIQRIIWDKKGEISHQETVTDEDVYTSFFEKMSKAVFLEQEGA
ncbi:MAG: hypothetical protein WBN23_16205 [Woeseia sp.]